MLRNANIALEEDEFEILPNWLRTRVDPVSY